ncbi:hypothetical protein DNTS_022207, partial [Danionella cerebrum]
WSEDKESVNEGLLVDLVSFCLCGTICGHSGRGLSWAALYWEGSTRRIMGSNLGLKISPSSISPSSSRVKIICECDSLPQSDTEFWDKMQAEWEELARRNWLEDADGEGLVPVNFSPNDKGYLFHSNNPYKDYSDAFEQGLQRWREGDLNSAVLLLEAAILQDPQDSEAWQVLGSTQAENENEQAAIVCLQRCLELHPNNQKALMTLAVSLTNTGQQPEACEALHRWIRFNPRYRHLLQNRSPLDGSPLPRRRGSTISPVSTLGWYTNPFLLQRNK